MVPFLLGIESYDEAMLRTIKKGATASEDQQAIQLLRRHGILSMATYVVGFEEETDADYWRSLRHLLRFDPDQIQMLYVTPHRWTPFFETVAERRVIETDTRRWDYKHQVLATARVPPWRIFMGVKAIEVIMQLRPRALLRVLFGKDRHVRHGMRWYTRMGRRVWFHEVLDFVRGKRLRDSTLTLRRFLGESLAENEESMARRRPVRVPLKAAEPVSPG